MPFGANPSPGKLWHVCAGPSAVNTHAADNRMASAEFVFELFGDRFDLWTGQGPLRRIRRSSGATTFGGRAENRDLMDQIRQTLDTASVQCRAVGGGFIVSIPAGSHQRPMAAVAEIGVEQVADVLQQTAAGAIGQQSRSEVPAGISGFEQWTDLDASDNRLRADESELSWLNQLPASVVPKREETSVTAVARRILPQLLDLIQARSLLLIDGEDGAGSSSALLWSGGDEVTSSAVDRVVLRYSSEASYSDGLCLNFTSPPQSIVSRDGIMSAVIVPVRWPARSTGWLVAVNRDLRKLATGEAASRYGSEIQMGDIEFGDAQINLMRAASSVLATNSGILDLLNDREQVLTGIVRTLVNALDAKDSYTCGHSDRVAEFARLTAQAMGVNARGCEQVHMAGLLHDIGKVGIPDHILNKPAAVTDEEMEIIRQHPVTGYEILRHLSSFEYVLPAVLHHHEAFDGSGYPHGLHGNAIPLSARILAVADSWDAMTSSRSYRAGMSPDRATAILQDGAGQQWDPQCVEAFLKCKDAVRVRMDAAHDEVPPPVMVRSAAVATMSAWPVRGQRARALVSDVATSTSSRTPDSLAVPMPDAVFHRN